MVMRSVKNYLNYILILKSCKYTSIPFIYVQNLCTTTTNEQNHKSLTIRGTYEKETRKVKEKKI